MNTSISAPQGTELDCLDGFVSIIRPFKFPTASGIDSLYYFIESNDSYKEFFHDSVFSKVEQAREDHGGYIPDKSLKLTISDIEFVYLGKEKGFYFFADSVGMFRVGFKDPATNKGVHDINVQLQGIGIYAMGLVNLADYINSTILREISRPNYYITRADLNIFCQYDLGSVIEPEYFVTRKKRFVRVIGTKERYETLYVGKPPARLRVYNKALEMDYTSIKAHFLQKYLEPFGITTTEPFWNFEFECHRAFLKQYKISTLEDLLTNAETLFHKMMKQVRYVEVTTISPKDQAAGRLYKAMDHLIWDYLDQAYTFNAAEQKRIPLERIGYSRKMLTANDFLEEFSALVDKYTEHDITLYYQDILEILRESELWLTNQAKIAVKPFVPIELQTPNRKYLLTRNRVAVPILPKKLAFISDDELKTYGELLTKALHQELSKNDQDIGLIVKHTLEINAEKDKRRAGQKELNLWQQ